MWQRKVSAWRTFLNTLPTWSHKPQFRYTTTLMNRAAKTQNSCYCKLTDGIHVHNVHTTQLDQPLDDVILPAGTERHSADDHSPLLTDQSRELDQVSGGELWEADDYEGEPDPASSLTLQARMETHMHKHRSQKQQKLLGTLSCL